MEAGTQPACRRNQLAGEAGNSLAVILDAVHKAAADMDDVAVDVEKSKAMAGEVMATFQVVSETVRANNEATGELIAGAAQVTAAVDCIAQVSQENAAVAQEVASSVEAMNESAERVVEVGAAAGGYRGRDAGAGGAVQDLTGLCKGGNGVRCRSRLLPCRTGTPLTVPQPDVVSRIGPAARCRTRTAAPAGRRRVWIVGPRRSPPPRQGLPRLRPPPLAEAVGTVSEPVASLSGAPPRSEGPSCEGLQGPGAFVRNRPAAGRPADSVPRSHHDHVAVGHHGLMCVRPFPGPRHARLTSWCSVCPSGSVPLPRARPAIRLPRGLTLTFFDLWC